MRLTLFSRDDGSVLSVGNSSQYDDHRIELADSQIDFIRWFSRQLVAGLPRLPPVKAFMIDKRRGGKTWAGLLALLASTIEGPGRTCVVVGSPGERDECGDIYDFFERVVPRAWYEKQGKTVPVYAFGSGSRIVVVPTTKLSDVPRSGSCLLITDYFLLKEKQFDSLMNFDGAVIVAGNAPFEPEERWFCKYKPAIKNGSILGFRVDPNKNQFIMPGGWASVAPIMDAISPGYTKADDKFWSDLA